MNAPIRRRHTPKYNLSWLLQSALLAVCVQRRLLSHAYSTSSTPAAAVNRPLASPSANVIDGRTLQQKIPDSINTSNNNVSRNKMARRAFFSATAAAMTTITTTSFAQPAHAASSLKIPSLGTPAPDFSLLNTRGQIITLDTLTASDSKKWTVLYFYPGAFTSGCTIEARKFQEELSNFQETNAQVVGVSVDGVEKISEFCTSENLDFYMLSDEGGKVSKAYGSSLSIPGFGTFSNRQTYIIDPEKNVRWVFVDVESRIPKHPMEVLEKLKELQSQA